MESASLSGLLITCFNTQPPEGGWTCYTDQATKIKVSTHSRPKAAGQSKGIIMVDAQNVSTHSRPKAAGPPPAETTAAKAFQHTAARRRLARCTALPLHSSLFQHTAARRRLGAAHAFASADVRFQHTAARRRLDGQTAYCPLRQYVSTHSRPKAAGQFDLFAPQLRIGFNTQPPEGGWRQKRLFAAGASSFNTQPPEGGWAVARHYHAPRLRVSTHSRPKAAGFAADVDLLQQLAFQHTAARRRLAPLSPLRPD